jgi:transposase-like protein
MFDLTNPIYSDADKARAYLEEIQWPNGPVCPHCGNVEQGTMVKVEGEKRSHRAGLYYCNACRDQFTVTVGTVFERSHVPLNKWVLAAHLMAASKKGVSGHQLMRTLGVTYKTAWFMAHRLREAMKEDTASSGPLGGEGKIIEADETYIGRKDDQSPSPQRKGKPYLKRKPGNIKRTVVALVERGGSVRSFHVETATVASVAAILHANADPSSTLYTDESRLYPPTGIYFGDHRTVKHSAGEYARKEGDKTVHTNTIENVFSVFKRGMHGIYQHCGEAHLHRYLAEFDFRYNRRSPQTQIARLGLGESARWSGPTRSIRPFRVENADACKTRRCVAQR